MGVPRAIADTRSVRESRNASKSASGWLKLKMIALIRKVGHRGLENVSWVFTFTAAAYNLARILIQLANSVGVE